MKGVTVATMAPMTPYRPKLSQLSSDDAELHCSPLLGAQALRRGIVLSAGATLLIYLST